MPLSITVAVLAVAAIAALTDIRSRKIPNWLAAITLPVGFALNWILFQWAGLKIASLGLGLAFAVYFVFYLLRAMGAGDVKLMAAIGSLIGPHLWLVLFFWSAVVGGAIGLVLLLIRGRMGKTLVNIGLAIHELVHFRAPYLASEELDVRSGKALRLPHAVSIGLGCICLVIFNHLQPSR